MLPSICVILTVEVRYMQYPDEVSPVPDPGLEGAAHKDIATVTCRV